MQVLGPPTGLLPWVPPLGKSPAARLAAGSGTEGPLSVDPARVWGAGEGPTIAAPALRTRHPLPLGARRGQGEAEGHDHPTEAHGRLRRAHRASRGHPAEGHSSQTPVRAPLRPSTPIVGCYATTPLGGPQGPCTGLSEQSRVSRPTGETGGWSRLHWHRGRGGSPARPRP